MTRFLLPLIAFAAVLAGLIAVEPPPTEEELLQKERRVMLKQIQADQTGMLDQIGKLEREKQQQELTLSTLESKKFDYPDLQDSFERLRLETEAEKAEAEESIENINARMESIERKAEDWVRAAYDLTPDALPPGYLARVLWKADGAAIAEAGKLAQDLRVTLHISESAAHSAAMRIRTIAKSGYARRTLVSAAAALATLALVESAEPVFGWIFGRWWKLLVAAIAGLLTLGAVVQLQKKGIFD